MVSKNNRPLLREHSASQRVPHYGLRKLSFGVASVLLSTTFFLGAGQAVHADTDTTNADTTEQNNETAQLAGTPSEATSQNVQSQPANSQTESSQAAQPANSVVSPSNYQSSNTYQQAGSIASISSGVGQGRLVKNQNSPSNSQITTSAVASSQSTSINPVQQPTTTIKLPVAANHDSATLTVRFKENKTGSTVAQTILTGQLGQKIPIDKLNLPNGFSAIDQGWSKNLPVLSTGHLDVLVAPTGSAELQQAQQQLLQAQQQRRLAALFGTNLAVNNGVVTNVENHSFGVDVSDYQGNDMQYYKNLGAKYAIIKVSEGTSSAGGSGAAAKAANAKAAGMMVMAYYFSHAWGNTSTAQAEANYAVNRALADGIPIHSYIALDYETSFSGDKQANTNAAIAAMQVIRNANYLPLFYSSSSMMNNYFYTDQIVQRFPGSLWVAAYKYKGAMNEPDFGYFPSRNGVAIWQFTDSWKGANVDGDINVLPLQFLQLAPTTATVTVQYVDDDNGGQIAATRSKTANVNSTVKYSDFALPTNMHWVSGDGNSTINVGTANSTITLHVVHNTQNVSDNKDVTRTWKITDPSGASSSGTQSATFTRNGVKDLVTNQIKWGNWSSNQVLSAVKVPTISGYTASGDIPQITVSEQTQPINITITYAKNSEPKPSRPVANDLSQRLINAAKSMLGYFDYDQVRPIKAALNGQDDTIKSLSDVDKNGKVDCSGFVWLAMKLAGEKVVRAQTGPWFTGSMANDATGAKNYLVQISPDQAQPGDIVIANLRTGTGDNGHTAVLNGYGVDYDWGSNTTANQILSTALPIVEMGGGKAHVNESTIKDAFSGLNQSGVQVIIARPVALADASDYAPDSYDIIVIDADNNNVQLSKQTVTTLLPASYASYVPTNYTMSGYSLNGTTITITVKHKVQGVSDSKTITRTVSIAEPNGQTKSAVQSITFNRTGTKDLVNGNISWGNWSDNGSYVFPSVTVPEIDNYTASGTVPDLTVTPDSNSSVVNITYTAKKPASSASSGSSAASSATTPSSSASSSGSSSADKPAASYHVQVVDVDDNNRTLKVSEVADNPTKEIDSFVPANYALKTYTLIGTQMVIEVTHQTKATTESRTLTRKITLTKPDGSTSSTTQSATISRQIVEDLVTHQSKPSPWSTSSWSAYRVPTILGYNPSQDSVPAVTVDGNTQNANINITYTAGTLTGAIDYIDPSGKLIKSTPWSGKVGSTIPINYVVPAGWRLVAGQTLPTSIIATTIVPALEVKIEHATTTVWPNAPKSTSDKLPDNADQTYPSGVGQGNLNKVITRTIEIVKPDGSTQSSQQTVKISRNATVDEVTKNVTYGNWSTGSFNAYDIPVISGYTASATSIPVQTVDGNSTDETIRVTYKANAQPTKPSSDQPAHSQQPSQPSSSSASQSQSTSQTPSSNPSSSSSQAKPATSDTPSSSQTSNAQSANQPSSQVTSQSGSQAKPASSDTPSSSQASNAQSANQPSSQTTSQSSSQAKPASQTPSSGQNSSAQPASQVPNFSQSSNAQLPSSNTNQNGSTASPVQSSAITSQTVSETSPAEEGLRNTAKPVSIKESPADQNNVQSNSYSTQGFSESSETSSISSVGNYQGTPQNASQSVTGGSELPQTGNSSSNVLALLGIGALGVVGAMSVSLKRDRKF